MDVMGGSYDFGSVNDKRIFANPLKMKEIPLEERPREKMLLHGVAALSDAELVAVLLRTGTAQKSALALAREMTADGGLYRRLAGMRNIRELTQIRGLGQAKAATVLAALEIGRRMASAHPLDRVHLRTAEDTAAYLMPRMRYLQNEQFILIMLNTKNKIINTEVVAEGSLASVAVQPRDVFQPAILQHAASIIVAHNHPSGECTPSTEDKLMTEQLAEAGKALGIPVLDHVIIGDGCYYSFEEAGVMEV